jgi:hypothetical protein
VEGGLEPNLDTMELQNKIRKNSTSNYNPSNNNTELAIHALDQVHCWDAYFRLRIGHYENFTLLNFQPLLFSKQWRLVDRRCTLEPLVAKKIMYKVPYSLKAV